MIAPAAPVEPSPSRLPESAMPTIVDIAKRVKMSPAAVSYALNNHPTGVSAETRRRIQAAARELGYRPNRRAKQLRARANLTLAFQLDSTMLVSERRRPTATLSLTTFQGTSAYAASRGYHVQLLMPPGGDDRGEIQRTVIEENAIDGVILLGLTEVDDAGLSAMASDLERVKVPAVTLDRRIASLGVPLVSLEREAAIRAAAQRIAERGHTRVGYVGLPIATVNEPRPRLAVFREALAKHGVELPERWFLHAGAELDAYRLVHELLGQGDRPTCLIFSGDHQAMAGLQAAAERGVRVPEDLSFVSMNNAPYARHAAVPLCTIDHLYSDIGVMLAKVLIDRLENPQAPSPAVSLLSTRFIERASLGPAPTSH